jgi:hypothetical protein
MLVIEDSRIGLAVMIVVVKQKPKSLAEHEAPDVFSVSRRFDMATVLVAMLGYSLLFGGMLMLDATPALIAIFGVFFAFIAIGQAVAINYGRPREASIIAGSIFWFVGAIIVLSSDNYPASSCAVLGALISAMIAGPISGYLAGALVGGVFLVSHYLREADLLRRRAPQAGDDDASPWGPLPKPIAGEGDDYEWPVMEVVSPDEDARDI